MDKYLRGFIFASLFYLLTGSAIGMAVGMGAAQQLRFTHVHFNLLGFMSMMIYGVGYFIIPRFNATVLKWPALVPVHFWVGNLSLLGMCGAWTVYAGSGNSAYGAIFGVCSALQFLSIVMFVAHLGISIMKPAESAAPAAAPKPAQPAAAPAPSVPVVQPQVAEAPASAAVSIHPSMPVGEIITRWPDTIPVLIEAGLRPIADPEHRAFVIKAGVPLQHAAMKHGLDLGAVLPKLEAIANGAGPAPAAAKAPARGELAGMIISDLLERFPKTEAVLMKYYGGGCFSCPGQKMETIEQSALMHNVPLNSLLDSLEKAIAG